MSSSRKKQQNCYLGGFNDVREMLAEYVFMMMMMLMMRKKYQKDQGFLMVREPRTVCCSSYFSTETHNNLLVHP